MSAFPFTSRAAMAHHWAELRKHEIEMSFLEASVYGSKPKLRENCRNCGANKYVLKNGTHQCEYCGTTL